MDWKFNDGDMVTFNTVQSDLVQYNGKTCEVVRRLTEGEADLFECGPMYYIRLFYLTPNSKRSYMMLDAFEDELTKIESAE